MVELGHIRAVLSMLGHSEGAILLWRNQIAVSNPITVSPLLETRLVIVV